MRPTWAEIDLESLAAHCRTIRRHVGDVAVMAVVKADAYGHGAVECAKRLARENVEWFGVALPEEAAELRANGIEQPILSLNGWWFGQEDLLLQQRITPVVYQFEAAERLNRAALARSQIIDVHVKIDAGMNRLGVRFDAVGEFAEKLLRFKNLRVDGLMTHFAAADDSAFNSVTDEQVSRFNQSSEVFRANGFRPAWFDMANTPGALEHPAARGNLVRIGGALCGIGKDIFPPSETVQNLLPVMSLRSKITLLKSVPKGETIGYSGTFATKRDSLIAIVPFGYNDGLPRQLSNAGKAIVNNAFAPVVGRISMDLTALDVTDVPGVKEFDAVVFAGAQGDRQISVEEIARQAKTISYEITCGISKRVPRIAKVLNDEK